MTKTNRIKHFLIDSNAEIVGGFLFDRKTAHSYNSLNNSVFLIDFKASTDLAPSQLFPLWKQLEQSGSFIQIENC